jgi:hypothetical protein
MATEDSKNTPENLSAQAMALAEQLGRIAGTVEGTAEAWLERQQLTEQLARVRDGAAKMLESLTAGVGRGRSASKRQPARKAQPAARRAADPAHAPGKRHRKPAPSPRGVKKSNEAIPKMRTATAARQRRKSYA